MAEETSLGVARAREVSEEPAISDHQGRIEETSEAIKEHVSEINKAVANQDITANETLPKTLDWRGKVRNRPVAWGLGALGMGILVGYGLAGLIESEDKHRDDDLSENMHSAPDQFEGAGPSAFSDHHSYAAHAHAIAPVNDDQARSGYNRPGLIHRFKETRAYDRLQEELSDLGNRFMDELSTTARNTVLPALVNKIKEIIRVDHSNKQKAERAATERPTPTRVSQTGITNAPVPNEDRTCVNPTAVDSGTTMSGKPAYPRAKESLNKFDRVANEKTAPSGQSDNSPHINLNYDDRYERESKLFSRGEIRGFASGTSDKSKKPEANVRSSERDNATRGKDYTYQPGRSSDSADS